MLELFVRHPRSVGETYAGHFAAAARFGVLLIAAGLACLVHAFLPFAFQHTASGLVGRLNDEMRRRATAARLIRYSTRDGRRPAAPHYSQATSRQDQ